MIQRKKKTGKLMRMLLTLAAVWMLMECMTAFAQESDGQLPNGKSFHGLKNLCQHISLTLCPLIICISHITDPHVSHCLFAV